MITIRKLRTLKPGTLKRKTAVILQAFEADLSSERAVDTAYLKDFLELAADVFENSAAVVKSASELKSMLPDLENAVLFRKINSLRHLVLAELGTEPADWDMSSQLSPVIRPQKITMHSNNRIEVFLDDIRSPFNIGSIFRTSEAFGVDRIILSPDCPDPEHPRSMRSAMGCTSAVEWSRSAGSEIFNDEKILNGDRTLFALELGGTPVSEFSFPRNGIAIVGSEELGISPAARAAVLKSGGLVSIPVYGLKGSINVSVAFGIMMQRWSERLN